MKTNKETLAAILIRMSENILSGVDMYTDIQFYNGTGVNAWCDVIVSDERLVIYDHTEYRVKPKTVLLANGSVILAPLHINDIKGMSPGTAFYVPSFTMEKKYQIVSRNDCIHEDIKFIYATPEEAIEVLNCLSF